RRRRSRCDLFLLGDVHHRDGGVLDDVRLEPHAFGRLDVRDVDRLGDLEVRDVDFDLLGDLRRLADDRQGAADLLEDAAFGHADGLAHEDDGDVHDHVLVHPHVEEIDVQDVSVYRVLVVVLEEDGAGLPVDLELDHGVGLVRGGDRLGVRLGFGRGAEGGIVGGAVGGGGYAGQRARRL